MPEAVDIVLYQLKQATTYLKMFDKNIDEFEEHMHEMLVDLISQFLGH